MKYRKKYKKYKGMFINLRKKVSEVFKDNLKNVKLIHDLTSREKTKDKKIKQLKSKMTKIKEYYKK